MPTRELTAEAHSILLEIFLATLSGKAPVNVVNYRIEHLKQVRLVDELTSAQLLNSDNDCYRVTFQALCFMRHEEVELTLHRCRAIFDGLFDQYRNERTRREPIRLGELAKKFPYEPTHFRTYISLLMDVKSFWYGGGSTDFSDLATAHVSVGQQILYNPALDDIVETIVSWYADPKAGLGAFRNIWVLSEGPTTDSSPKPVMVTGEFGIAGPVEFRLSEMLHPVVGRHALKHFLDGHYRDAVLNSIIAVFDLIRERTGLKSDGEKLITRAFSEKDPYLILSNLDSETGRNDQIGFMDIYRGAFKGIRNPKAHTLSHDLDPLKAAQYLVLASLLARRVDEAKVVKKED